MRRDDAGYHVARVEGLVPGARYRFSLDGDERSGPLPDPASRWQPDDVHGDSAVIEPGFTWSDAGWTGLPLADYVIYELHVGTFTPEGTFDAVIERLDAFRDLGITAIELMPVAEFPGGRNWGYDGVFPYAAESAYGGPDGLRRLVDAAHRRGLAVVLDVVYNHLGPEGNVLPAYGPYFTDRYRTPWGDALNFDGPGRDEVRRFFVENACSWIGDFRIDALRLDAVHAIADPERVSVRRGARRRRARVRRPARPDGARDRRERRQRHPAHHAQGARRYRLRRPVERRLPPCAARAPHRRTARLLRRLRRTRRSGDCLRARLRLREPLFVVPRPPARTVRCRGLARPSIRRVRPEPRPGRQPRRRRSHRDPGRRGRRTSSRRRACLCSPFLPLLFMGEEYGETNPFPYFVSHSDPALVEAVRQGRRAEFASLAAQEPPDPQAEATFDRAKLDWAQARSSSRMPRCSSGIARCWRCARAGRRCASSTRPSSRRRVRRRARDRRHTAARPTTRS